MLAFLGPAVSLTPGVPCSCLAPTLCRSLRKEYKASEGLRWERKTKLGWPTVQVCLGPRGFLRQGTSSAKTRIILSKPRWSVG